MKNDELEDDNYVSKSQRKRDMHALQAMGAKLLDLGEEKLRAMNLPEKLLEALLEGKRINQRGARKRQLQYIGKIMRQIDVEPVSNALQALDQSSSETKAAFHRLEQWRDKLLSDDDNAVTEFMNTFDTADGQTLRQLIRNTKQEKLANRPPRYYRKLFQYIKSVSLD